MELNNKINLTISKIIKEESGIINELSDIKDKSASKYSDKNLIDMAVSSYGLESKNKISKNKAFNKIQSQLKKKGLKGTRYFKILGKVSEEIDNIKG